MVSERLNWPVLLGLYGSFWWIGVIMGMTGPLVPFLRADLGLGYGPAGLLFSAQSVGGLCVLLAGGWLVHQFGKKTLLFAGAVSFALGLVLTALADGVVPLLAGNVLIGGGMSLLDVAVSTLIIDAHPEGKGKALGRLHFYFGAGAVVGPLLALVVGHLDGGWRWGFALAALGPLSVAILVPFLKTPAAPEVSTQQKFGVYRQPFLWWGALAMMAYCGVEWGLGAWFPSYWQVLPIAASLDPAWATSAFWLTFAVGRFVVGSWADRWGFPRFLAISMGLTLLVTVLWLVFPAPTPSLVWVLLIGFLIAGQYPTLVAWISHRFPASSGQVTSFLSVFASLGTFVWPPAIGAWADQGGIAVLPWAEMGLTVLMVVLTLVAFLAGRKTHE